MPHSPPPPVDPACLQLVHHTHGHCNRTVLHGRHCGRPNFVGGVGCSPWLHPGVLGCAWPCRDDVIRAAPIVDKKATALADVSQEKSKLGLGDLYAEEYRRTALGVKVDDGVEKQRVRD